MANGRDVETRVTPAGSLLRFLGFDFDLPVLLGLRTGPNVRDVRIDAGFGRPVAGLLGAGRSARAICPAERGRATMGF